VNDLFHFHKTWREWGLRSELTLRSFALPDGCGHQPLTVPDSIPSALPRRFEITGYYRSLRRMGATDFGC